MKIENAFVNFFMILMALFAAFLLLTAVFGCTTERGGYGTIQTAHSVGYQPFVPNKTFYGKLKKECRRSERRGL